MKTRRYGSAAMACLLWTAASCGDDGNRAPPPPEPVVIESARTRVLVGADTVLVFGPTMFAYFAVDDDVARPPAGLIEFAQTFQTSVQSAQEPLRALGVRVEAVNGMPTVLDVTAQGDAAAGPQPAGSSFGFLFVDAAGHLRRVTSRMDAADMVCVAASTFGLTLDARQGAACG